MTVHERLENVAWSFRNALTADERKKAVRAAFLLAGDTGIKVLARLTGRNEKKLRKIGKIGEFRREVYRWGRGRGPNPRQRWLEEETAQVAEAAAGGYGELRYSRRDASRSTTNRRSRKI
ncbi:MAG: hypothetical protein K6U74_08645 [Firmicutes bacterium]|nr:hypothetical protein [Bacillota bacterium]